MRGISTIFNIKRYERGMTNTTILYTLVRSLVLDLISTWKDTSFDHGYVPLVVETFRSFPHSWLITWFVTRQILRVRLAEKELLTLPYYLNSPPVFTVVPVTRSLVLYVCFVDRCLSFCSYFFWPLCCLFFFDLQNLNTLWYLETLLTITFLFLYFECSI